MSTVSFSGGAWAIDDGGSLYLNGNFLGSLSPFQRWVSLTSVSIPNGDFVQGVNTLTINLTDSDRYLEAVRFQGTVSGELSAVPEPTTIAGLFGLGGMGLVALVWRRRRRKTCQN